MEHFHPLVQRWFRTRLGEPSLPQRQGWPLIAAGGNVLIAAPTGSGKTLAAFLSTLDGLFRRALEGSLEERTYAVYVSPLKALGNDVQKNLLAPLAELWALARAEGLSPAEVRVLVRTGDTPSSERARMVKKPPHILITTPESLYLVLTAARSREALRGVETVIVDEIHALARDKRGSHLALSLERLNALCPSPPQRVGLSATQRPLPVIASYLVGGEPGDTDGPGAPWTQRPCAVVEVGHVRPWELSVEVPDGELTAVASHEAWGQIYDRLGALAEAHRTVLVFANTRKLAERVAHDLGERLGPGLVAAHHGSMSRELRLLAEEKLKRGGLRLMVATASLELGIDIGSIDLVCQLGTPRSISALLQRVGRAGHQYGGISKGILFAMTRDELVECAALVRAVREGDLDRVRMPERPLDALAQQLVAACAADEWEEVSLFRLCRRAHPYRELSMAEFEGVVHMLSEGVSTRRGRARVHLHRDRVNGMLRARKGARITAVTNAGTIPDTFTYPVVAEPEGVVVGTLDEDFAVESTAGDVFLLGSTAWRFQRILGGTVRVENAAGQAPSVPFWRGEAPSRSDELSAQVSRLRQELVEKDPDEAQAFLREQVGLSAAAADALVTYLRAAAAALGGMPSMQGVVAERFFDEAGGMQLLLHAPFGGRINRAWGLALRKRFCRTFDFELQAAATDDGVLLSLGEQHSFPLDEVFSFLSPDTVEEVLTQAVLQAPLFPGRFRWSATRALALSRFSSGKRVPPVLQRARAEDLLAAVFPAQVGCQDNHGGGDIEVPDHPLVTEAMRECLTDALDVQGLREVLRGIRDGRIATRAVDLPEPSPLSHALLNSQPYTYLDEAPLEERRARAVSLRRTLSAQDAAGFGALDADAIRQVLEDARPPMRDADELHDTLLQRVLMPAEDAPPEAYEVLVAHRRAASLEVPGTGRRFLVGAERVPHAEAVWPGVPLRPPLARLEGDPDVAREAAVLAVVRGHLEECGPVTAADLAARLCLPEPEVLFALHALESEGQALRGTFRPAEASGGGLEFCDRRLLQRIHRLTVGRLRREIEPLSAQDHMRFLFRWHHLDEADRLRGKNGLLKAVALLQGYEAPASAWERWLFPVRMKQYLPELLERACWEGEVAFCRLTPRDEPRPEAPGPRRGAAHVPQTAAALEAARPGDARGPLLTRNAQLTFVRRESLDWMLAAARGPLVLDDGELRLPPGLSHAARDVAAALERKGACFFQDLVGATRRLPAEVEDGLWELLARGVVTADAVDNLRVLQSPAKRQRRRLLQRGGPGRWSLLSPSAPDPARAPLEEVARLVLWRYGVVFREVAMREPLVPSWRELLAVYRRMEARGEVRGGRFVAHLAGEQYALPEAVELARAVRRAPLTGEVIQLSGVDPLNLTGIVTPGPRVPATVGQVVTYVDGLPQQEAARPTAG
jgi:ATP-dependent Lhr-like helicase